MVLKRYYSRMQEFSNAAASPGGPAPRIVAIVPAAGVGARATARGHAAGVQARPKQYRPIAGQPMLRWAVRALLQDPRVDEVVVGVSATDEHVYHALHGLPRTRWLATGGPSRHATVHNTLAACDLADTDWVLVHDAARPGLPAQSLRTLIDLCLGDPVGGLLAMPVADTIKQDTLAPGASASGTVVGGNTPPRVARTLTRDHLWQAQTPQMFRVGLLQAAFAHALKQGLAPTDEAGSVEGLGYQPLLVPGSLANLKVTWPQDFEWIEKWLA